jgi:glycosyltransferase involved in cell wall biosynthesis
MVTISIITAAFNRVGTIGQAMGSVQHQTFTDIEHIIIDAQSTDGTLEKINRRRTSAVRLISEPDGGIYDALNKGMRMARGNILGVVHSDDFLAHNNVLERVAEAFTDPTIDAVYGDLDYVAADDTDRVVRHWRAGAFTPKKLSRGWMPPHPTLFVRRRVVETLGAYDTHYRIAGDYDAILRWFGSGIRSVYIPEVLVKMRAGGESNRSLERILLKSREDLAALRKNKIGGIGALMLKNISKVPQFLTPS